jgi:hypothetical protein
LHPRPRREQQRQETRNTPEASADEFFSTLGIPTCAIYPSIHPRTIAVLCYIAPTPTIAAAAINTREASTDDLFSTLGPPTTCNIHRNEFLLYIANSSTTSAPHPDKARSNWIAATASLLSTSRRTSAGLPILHTRIVDIVGRSLNQDIIG